MHTRLSRTPCCCVKASSEVITDAAGGMLFRRCTCSSGVGIRGCLYTCVTDVFQWECDVDNVVYDCVHHTERVDFVSFMQVYVKCLADCYRCLFKISVSLRENNLKVKRYCIVFAYEHIKLY